MTSHFPARLIKHHLLPIPASPGPSTHKPSRERALWKLLGLFQGQAQPTEVTAMQRGGESEEE